CRRAPGPAARAAGRRRRGRAAAPPAAGGGRGGRGPAVKSRTLRLDRGQREVTSEAAATRPGTGRGPARGTAPPGGSRRREGGTGTRSDDGELADPETFSAGARAKAARP